MKVLGKCMDAKTYRGQTIREALDLIREELGPNASVLHCRRIRRPGVRGWITGGTDLEVVASVQNDVPSRLPGEALKWLPPDTQAAYGARIFSGSVKSASSSGNFEAADPERSSTTLGHLNSLRRGLGLAGVDSQIADGLIDQISKNIGDQGFANSECGFRQIARKISETIPLGGELHCQEGVSHWVALVGECGVGKTSVVAKLATAYSGNLKQSVALVKIESSSDRRIPDTALDEFAELMKIPVFRVDSTNAMQKSAPQLTEKFDLVLMDTPGIESRETPSMTAIQEILNIAKPDEVQWVVPAYTKPHCLGQSASDMAALKPTGLILTHLDETFALHHLWPALQEIAWPVNYLTHGTRVPEDLTVADAKSMERWLHRSLSAAVESEAAPTRNNEAIYVA